MAAFRLQEAEVDQFIQQSRVQPGTLKHLYPDARTGAEGAEQGDGEGDELQ